MRRHLVLALVFATAFAPQLRAQEAIRAYVNALPQMAQRDVATEAASAPDRTERAFAALELHVRSGNEPDAARALRYFAELVKAEPENAWAHYGFGLTLSRVKSKTAAYRVLNVDNQAAINLMEHEIRRAMALDSSLTEAQALLGDLNTRLATSVVPHHLVYDAESNGNQTAIEDLQRAATLFRHNHDDDGAKLYYAGLQRLDSLSADAYAEDLRLLASDEEMLMVTDGDFAKRAEAIRRFWRKRATRDGVSEAQRIGSHYRRLAVAIERYRPPFNTMVTERRADGRKRQGLERVLDDRGLIYVRYGEPVERAGGTAQAFEAWAYPDAAGRNRMFFFANGHFETNIEQFGQDEKIARFIESNDARAAFLGAHLETIRLYDYMLRVVDPTDIGYRMFIANQQENFREDNVRLAHRIRERTLALLFDGLANDAAPPKYAHRLVTFADFATFRGKGCTDLIYSVLAPVPSYHLNVAVADTFTWDVQKVDTTIAAREFVGASNLRAAGVFCTAPDPNAYVRVTVNTDSSGATTGGEFNVKDYSGTDLMMSDMLFTESQPGSFVRGNAHLSLVPPRQFQEGQPIRVFYELYNLPRGHRYKTEITVGKNTVTFDDVANTDDVVQELRSVLPQVKPGEVDYKVKVTDEQTGQSTSSKKKIWIIPASR